MINAGSEDYYSGQKKRYEKKTSKPSKVTLEKYDFLISAENELMKKLKGKEDILVYYFPKKFSEGRNPGQMMLVGNEFDDKFKDIDSVKDHWNTISKKKYIEEFSEELYMYQSSVYDIDGNASDDIEEIDVIKDIHKMDISENEKWKLQDIFLFPEKHRENLIELLEISLDVIKNNEEKMLAYNEVFVDYWTKTLSDVNVEDFIYEGLGIRLDPIETGYQLRSNIFAPNAVTIDAIDDEEVITGPYVMRLGFIFDDDYPISRKANVEKYEDKAIAALKLLSDKSKFEILSMLKNQKTYGGELARKLNLTPATISHHMSALLLAGLVKVEKEDNKLYYSTNEEEVSKLLAFCSEQFL